MKYYIAARPGYYLNTLKLPDIFLVSVSVGSVLYSVNFV